MEILMENNNCVEWNSRIVKENGKIRFEYLQDGGPAAAFWEVEFEGDVNNYADFKKAIECFMSHVEGAAQIINEELHCD